MIENGEVKVQLQRTIRWRIGRGGDAKGDVEGGGEVEILLDLERWRGQHGDSVAGACCQSNKPGRQITVVDTYGRHLPEKL